MRKRGFSLVEVAITIGLIAILAGLISLSLYHSRANAKLARVSSELQQIATALSQYAEDNNYQYPADVGRGVPPGVEKYLSGGVWPASVWPHGMFDYDNIIHPGPGANQGKQIYQIVYRLCGSSGPLEDCSDPVLFPTFTRNSGIIYCISGPCIPHQSEPTAPAYCINCDPKKMNY